MNNEEFLEKEILKIDHDEFLNELIKKYPLEDGYDIEVISNKSIDAKTEKLVIKITNSKIKETTLVK